MRALRFAAWALAGALLALLLPVSVARAATVAEVEAALATKINQGRGSQGRGALLTHAGLQQIAGDWSANMAATNSLSHGNFTGRVNAAPPDPAEGNGPPDDGFTGWCENIAFNQVAQSASADTVAQAFYNQWFNSTQGHKECMLSLSPTNFGQNVMGVGIVYDSADSRWWATLDVAGDTSPPGPANPYWRRYEETHSSITYSGSWTAFSHSSASGGGYTRANATGASARFKFAGYGVRWIGLRGPPGGYAEVFLDGVLVATVSQYNSTTTYQRTLFERSGLTYGVHTLEVRRTASKHPSATSYHTWVDGFMRLA